MPHRDSDFPPIISQRAGADDLPRGAPRQARILRRMVDSETIIGNKTVASIGFYDPERKILLFFTGNIDRKQNGRVSDFCVEIRAFEC